MEAHTTHPFIATIFDWRDYLLTSRRRALMQSEDVHAYCAVCGAYKINESVLMDSSFALSLRSFFFLGFIFVRSFVRAASSAFVFSCPSSSS